MNCCKHKYFVIYRGDDTDFPGNQELIVELNTERDLTGCSAHFSFQGFTQDFAEIPSDKKLRLVIPNSETGKFALGAADAKLWLTNGTKIRTVENRIHVVVTNNVNEAYNNDDPQAITVTISGGGGGATVVLDDTVTEESPNGVKSSGIWSWVKSLLPKWLTSDYAEPATAASVAAKADKTALDDKRDKDDLAVYEKVGVGDDWRFSDCPDDFRDWIETRGDKPHFFEGDNLWSMSGAESEKYRLSTATVLAGGDAAVLRGFAWTDNESKELISPTITRSYQLRPVSPDDSLAKMSQLADAVSGLMPRDRSAGEEMVFPLGNVYLGGISKTAGWEKANGFYTKLGGFMAYDWDLFAVGFDTPQTLPQYLDSLNWRTTGNRTLSDYGITDGATKASLALEYSATSAYSVGAIVYHDGSIYQCKTAIADGGEAWNAEHWELRKLGDFFTGSNSLLTATIDARLPYPLYAVPSTGLLKDRAINTTSLASVTVPDNFTDLLVRASVASSLAVTMPEGIATKYGDTFPGEAGEYLITITKTGAAEAYVRTIKLEEVA